MTQITIPELTTATALPLNSLFPFENTQLNQTQNTTLNTILSYVEPKTKLYINNVLSGTYPAINLIAGNNISFTTSNNSNYFNVTLNSAIPSPLSINNVGSGIGIYKNFTSTYNLKSLVAGANVTLTPDTDSITIGITNVGEINTLSNVGTGISLFKPKVSSDLRFKTLVAGTNVTLDASNPDQITINCTGGSSSSSGQNIGVGIGKVYSSTNSSVLKFKSIKAGNNIEVIDGLSEITINAIPNTTGGLSNSAGTGSLLLNNISQIKTLTGTNGIIVNDTLDTVTISTNINNNVTSVGTGVSIYKGFNTLIDKQELKSIKSQDGIIVESLNSNEIIIRGNVTGTINSTSSTNTLISSQLGSTTTLKTINTTDNTLLSINNNTNDLTLTIFNTSNKWNANKINGVPITFPISPLTPEQESTLIYRGGEYVTGTPNNLLTKNILGQSFGSTIPSDYQLFKPSSVNTWSLALPTDINYAKFLCLYLGGKLYINGQVLDGFTSLIAGSIYYLNSSSTISTTSSAIVAGIAINSTTLWFKTYAA